MISTSEPLLLAVNAVSPSHLEGNDVQLKILLGACVQGVFCQSKGNRAHSDYHNSFKCRDAAGGAAFAMSHNQDGGQSCMNNGMTVSCKDNLRLTWYSDASSHFVPVGDEPSCALLSELTHENMG